MCRAWTENGLKGPDRPILLCVTLGLSSSEGQADTALCAPQNPPPQDACPLPPKAQPAPGSAPFQRVTWRSHFGEVPGVEKEEDLLASASFVHRCPSSEGSSPQKPRGQPGYLMWVPQPTQPLRACFKGLKFCGGPKCCHSLHSLHPTPPHPVVCPRWKYGKSKVYHPKCRGLVMEPKGPTCLPVHQESRPPHRGQTEFGSWDFLGALLAK